LRRMPERRRYKYARGGKRNKRRQHAHCCNEQYAILVLNGQLQLQKALDSGVHRNMIYLTDTGNGGVTKSKFVDAPIQVGEMVFETAS
jgi:hypothetical protein